MTAGIHGVNSRRYNPPHDLRLILDVAEINSTVIDRALNSDLTDFEDAVQYFSALEEKVDAVITRNPSDFPKKDTKILTPTEYRAISTT